MISDCASTMGAARGRKRHVIENPEFRSQILERIPLGRIADPKDVVGPVMFFCSDAAAFVTGQIMYVDGGITASQ